MENKQIKKKIKIIFWGTPEFSAIILNSLIKNDYLPIAVVTAPDKPKGRNYVLSTPSVKKIALKYSIPYLQPIKISAKGGSAVLAGQAGGKENKELKNKITSLKPDLFIVAAYGLIIPEELFKIPPKGAINVHPSLLPEYRGPSPIQTAIYQGDNETGVTLILMTEKMDEGPIIKMQNVKIKNKNYEELSNELANLGADLLIKTLPDWLEGKIKPIPQDESRATYTKIIKKEDGLIDFNKSAEEIERQIRAFSPWPGAYLKIPNSNYGGRDSIVDKKNKILKILEAEVLLTGENKKKGLIFPYQAGPSDSKQKGKELAITCSFDSLLLKKVQLEGKKKMDGISFLNGHRYLMNKILV